MAKLADDVFARRAERNAAKSELDGRVSKIRSDLGERGIAGRIADIVSTEIHDTFDSAMEVASESKGVIAGTIALLVIWFFRNPIISWFEELLGHQDENERQEDDD